ncbi:RHOMBOID-like protein 10, chloroplastic isoform X2 [Cryptomeria japonica]|uniref:RHOMBOID-like protein 10, chloroplastic isoform X2 n=1 Tax=Cryptomeria japonica TaxID=3369 RepID=UPI0025ACB10C|nr:RHOMBOID-like protein 10, chloroplastic isoform X2 [Cryptomeria japonica]
MAMVCTRSSGFWIGSQELTYFFLHGVCQIFAIKHIREACRKQGVEYLVQCNLLLNIVQVEELYVGQIVSRGKVTFWGAKVNSLINDGQTWRLVTSSFLHANVVHLLVNCFSLNSVGPMVEELLGPKRFFAVYMASAITSATMSYYLNKASSLGASGAIFGLVGSLAVFNFRHKNLSSRGWESLIEIALNIAANMVLGHLSQGIDKWGHVGGMIGGASLSWLIGPAFSYESVEGGRNRVLVDKPPISFLLGLGRHPK